MGNPLDEPSNVPLFWSKTTWIQLGYGMWANQVVVLIGLAFGFSAVAVPQLTEPNATFTSTMSQRAWIASVVVLTAPIGCLSCGMIMDRIGRKWTLVICLVPMVAGWIYTASSKSASQMIHGRILTGVGVGLCAGPPRTYTTEISLPYIRGVTGVLPTFAVSIGIFLQTLMGNLFRWQMIAYICSLYAFVVMLMNYFLPETPYYVLIGGNFERTKKCLRKIRAKNYDIENEYEELLDFRQHNKITKLPFKKTFSMLLQPQAYKPFIIIMVYLLSGQLAGISVMMFWTVDILKSSKVSIDPYIGNLLMGCTRVLSGIGSSILIFWVSRRPLAIGSALAVSVLCIMMGVFLMVNERPTIIPLLLYLMYVACAMAGFYTMPLLMLYEMIPLQIRGSLGGITVSLSFLMMFFVNASFPYVHKYLGMAVTLILFGMFALLGALYLFIFLPETKHLTLQEIEEFYKAKRDSLELNQHRLSYVHRHRMSLAMKEAALREEAAQNEMKTLKERSDRQSNVKFRVLSEEEENIVGTSKEVKKTKKDRSVSFSDIKDVKTDTPESSNESKNVFVVKKRSID